MGFTWEDAIVLGAEVLKALVQAALEKRSPAEAVAEARAVLDRRLAIDADVDAAARGTPPG